MEASQQGGGIAALMSMIESADDIVALTGAGISTESGIPDFRSPGGIWSRMQPITYQEFVASEEARLEDWRRRFRMNADFARAEPNAGHRALAALARQGRLTCLITQNIDGLHQRAGHPGRDDHRNPRKCDPWTVPRLSGGDAARRGARPDRGERNVAAVLLRRAGEGRRRLVRRGGASRALAAGGRARPASHRCSSSPDRRCWFGQRPHCP